MLDLVRSNCVVFENRLSPVPVVPRAY